MIGRVIAILFLSLVGLVGLGMSLCGGLFTFTGLLDSGSGGGEMRARDFLAFSVPSLVIGVAIVFGAFAGLRRINRKAARSRGARPSSESGEER
jgi:hypothetical protein